MSKRYDDDFEEMNAIQRDRYERRMRTRRKSLATNILIGVIILAIVAAVVIVAVTMINKNKTSDPADTTASVAATETATEKPTETRQPSTSAQQQQQQQQQQATINQPATEAAQQPSTEQASQADATTAPVQSAGALHYYTYGSTSEGWDYTYYYDPSVVTVSCNYNTAAQQYDFIITGVSTGTTTLDLTYYVGDNNPKTVTLTVYVDANLNVTQV